MRLTVISSAFASLASRVSRRPPFHGWTPDRLWAGLKTLLNPVCVTDCVEYAGYMRFGMVRMFPLRGERCELNRRTEEAQHGPGHVVKGDV